MRAPPFCPYSTCTYHTRAPVARWWIRSGFYDTKCFGPIPRFRCRSCQRTFSSQTFSTNYYAKRKVDFHVLEGLIASSMSIRSLSRTLKCSCGTVVNRTDRLARQAISIHAQLRPCASLHEDVCIDGLVSFDRSQYFPNNITIAITADSRYALSFTHATLRRSGSMRSSQKKIREKLYRGLTFEQRALERSFSELLDELERDRTHQIRQPLVVITDEKREYVRAFKAHRLFRNQDADHRTVHRTVSSRLPRTFLNPLFASNYLDREIRKDQAAHRRESTSFGRNVANGMSRMACYLGWHNYSKRFLIKASVKENKTHAEKAGISSKLINDMRRMMFKKRAFLSLLNLDPTEKRVWLKSFPTPGMNRAAYLPAFALG